MGALHNAAADLPGGPNPSVSTEDPFAAAVELLRAEDYERAAVLLRRCVRAAPDDAAALAYLGMARFHLREVSEAKEHLDRAVEVGPQEFLAWAKRGEYMLRMGFYPQAVEDLKRALVLGAPTPASRQWTARLLEEAQVRARTSFVRTLALPKLPNLPNLPMRAVRRVLARLGNVSPGVRAGGVA